MSRPEAAVIAGIGAVLFVVAGPVAGAELGRLFFTPAERVALEQVRREADVEAVVVAEPELPPEVEPVIEEVVPEQRPPLTVNGFVRRSRGPATVWINGIDSYQGDLTVLEVERASLRIDKGRVSFEGRDGHTGLALKPGQTFMPSGQAITDVYERAVAEDAGD